jgi:exonuclease III
MTPLRELLLYYWWGNTYPRIGYEYNIRKERTRHSGGVALYIRENLPHSVRGNLDIRCTCYRLEIMCMKIDFSYIKSSLVSTLYRPPSADTDLVEDYTYSFDENCDADLLET